MSENNTTKFANRPIPKATSINLDVSGKKREYLVEWQLHNGIWELEKNIKQVSHFKRLVHDLRNVNALIRQLGEGVVPIGCLMPIGCRMPIQGLSEILGEIRNSQFQMFAANRSLWLLPNGGHSSSTSSQGPSGRNPGLVRG
ncbi:hypothetical protein H310_09561 [Aphanomyces invadans]|uniref:Chromo domain-containing protein n=1 Tax=Aphanomyces invadans TaxID=157072 RepID=A0A024TUL1_9STRA|nr:hypothetical protein H310_09561 [Aphanomyces invadans]ETV97674.1 hypothetical protein H310_09561 [Aphanomyces invadans]|eukprot:XP_008873883.1 hypothetical protein H310_09561 [Aphanomyces invadans]